MKKTAAQKQIMLFEEKEIRRAWHNEQWYFAIIDIVRVLTDSAQPDGYLKDMRRRDKELAQGWGQIATPLSIETRGGAQKVNCANLQGIFRIIQSIPSPKAEPFKIWLARVGQERIQEINDPELALNRSRELWQKHGRSGKWIQQRMMGQETRNKLTDYWSEHNVKKGDEFAILTNIIHEEWSGLSVRGHKNLKGLKTQNLRDHMSEEELIFSALAELSTRKIAETEKAEGLAANKIPAKKGGRIAKDARIALEEKIGKSMITAQNFLPKPKNK